MKKYVIALLVNNSSGVLTRISGMFARRGFNIDSLTVGTTEIKDCSRMTIAVMGEDYDRDQIIKQLSKMHDVREIEEMDVSNSVMRELLIMKISALENTKQNIMDAVNVFRSKIIDYSPNSICVEMTGESSKLDAFIELMRPYGIIEMCRTGVVALERGTGFLKTLE